MAIASRGRVSAVDPKRPPVARSVHIAPIGLPGTLRLPHTPGPVIVFLQVGGGNDAGLRNMIVADSFNRYGLGTLLFDVPAGGGATDGKNLLAIAPLAEQVVEAVRWLEHEPEIAGRALGLFGSGIGTAAGLVAVTRLGGKVGAFVARGGGADLAEAALDQVRVPTLLIVGSADAALEPSRRAFARLQGPKALEIVPGASHLFGEPGALDMAILHAARWFQHYLGRFAARL